MPNKSWYILIAIISYLLLVAVLPLSTSDPDALLQTASLSPLYLLPIFSFVYYTHKYLFLKEKMRVFWMLPLVGMFSGILASFLLFLLSNIPWYRLTGFTVVGSQHGMGVMAFIVFYPLLVCGVGVFLGIIVGIINRFKYRESR